MAGLCLTPVLISAYGWPWALRIYAAVGLAWAVRASWFLQVAAAIAVGIVVVPSIPNLHGRHCLLSCDCSSGLLCEVCVSVQGKQAMQWQLHVVQAQMTNSSMILTCGRSGLDGAVRIACIALVSSMQC